jgi:hypothetical protein
MVRNKGININYIPAYFLLKIDNERLLFTFFNGPDTPGLQIMFFTHNFQKSIHKYSIALEAYQNNKKLYLVYAADNHLLYNIINKNICKYLIYYLYLETDKARQLIDNVLEEYKDE